MGKTKKDELWAEAKKKCRLNVESIKKAKEMGLNPISLIKNIPSPSEQWKVPVHQWIDNMYEKRKEESAKKKIIKKKMKAKELLREAGIKAEAERIKFGSLARFFNPYKQEVNFAKKNKFDFVQLWYDKNGLYVNQLKNENVKNIKQFEFPSIVHAVLDINDFKTHLPILQNILKHLKHKEIIIHPICESEVISENSIIKLSQRIKETIEFFENKVTIYLENNSKLDPIFQTKEEVAYIFKENPTIEFLLDIAHIDSYEHLEELIKIKYPKILHISDKHFNVEHEHLPVGKGEIDFEKVFTEYLNEIKGMKIILEVFQSDEDIIQSTNMIKAVLEKKDI